MNHTARFWALVPAAGIGSRMGAEIPKQYLRLHGKTILEHTLERLLQIPELAGVLVAINAADTHWPELPLANDARIQVVEGGDERRDSVLNGLRALEPQVDEQDWVLVHDAARPCVRLDNICAMCEQLEGHPVGGILGVPVADTLKRSQQTGDGTFEIEATVDRSALWRAQTPQMFRFGVLYPAIQQALAEGYAITDEASAVEHAGLAPLMVEGRSDNIKITRPEDLVLAEVILTAQAQIPSP